MGKNLNWLVAGCKSVPLRALSRSTVADVYDAFGRREEMTTALRVRWRGGRVVLGAVVNSAVFRGLFRSGASPSDVRYPKRLRLDVSTAPESVIISLQEAIHY
jgi:hypothetical protein